MHFPRPSMHVGLALLILCAKCLKAQDAKSLEGQYKNKFVVVLKDGLAVGLCSEKQPNWPSLPRPILTVVVFKGKASYHEQNDSSTSMSGCTSVVPEEIHKGEVLKVESAKLQTVFLQGPQFGLVMKNVSPHAIERGVGAFTHQVDEQGEMYIVFKLDDRKDIGLAASYAGEWFKVFDSQDSAAQFGNTESGIYVKQIKQGMTIAEVESVLGPPQTRVDLADKILYKYKDMTVEFREGKVADVR